MAAPPPPAPRILSAGSAASQVTSVSLASAAPAAGKKAAGQTAEDILRAIERGLGKGAPPGGGGARPPRPLQEERLSAKLLGK
jgi:membrane protein involved in colicin uptake